VAAFRFRAAAALDIRPKEEDAAAIALARAESDWRAAEARADLTRVTLHAAERRADDAARAGASGAELDWHRNWTLGLAATIVRLDADVKRLAADMGRARTLWQDARRRRLALERLRDRMWRRFLAAEHAHELKQMDELARLRHLAGAETSGRR
jgi:flagellar export protein FliJ